jgi:hypothetical protein
MTTSLIDGIGIWGSGPGAGKSTVAKIIKEIRPEFKIRPFSGPIKMMVESLLIVHGYSYSQIKFYLHDPVGKEIPIDLIAGKPSARKLLQTLGTEWGRELISPEIWVNAWREECLAKKFIADDVRFIGEVNVVKSLHGQIVAVVGHNELVCGEHKSEMLMLSNFQPDHIIHNNGSIEELKIKIKTALGI